MKYNYYTNIPLNSYIYIIRDVNYGYLLENIHSHIVIYLFIIIYLYVFKYLNITNNSNLNRKLFNRYVIISGIILLILFIAVSFIGYILINGNLSYWGITVILTLLSNLYNIGFIVAG